MVALKGWPLAPVVYDDDFRRPQHQLLEANLVYVRDVGKPDLMSVEQLAHLALVAHHVDDSSVLAHLCLLTLARRSVVTASGPEACLASLTAD